MKQHSGVYTGPKKCLRTSQISGWVTSEVDRRKKACVKAALKAVSTGVVEAKKVAKKVATGCEKDGYFDGCVTEIRVVNKETAGLGCKHIPEFSHLSLKVSSTNTAFRIERILDE